MNNQDEFKLQASICEYISRQYPDVLFLSDTRASVKLTMGQAMRSKKLQKDGFKCPDLIILEPKKDTGSGVRCGGLFLEIKKETPYKKDGNIKASQNDHLELQHQVIIKLTTRGYVADFVWEFEQAKKIIDWYLKS